MLSAMAYTILKLHKSEYEAVPCRALSLDTTAAAVATRVSVTVWITSHASSRLAAS